MKTRTPICLVASLAALALAGCNPSSTPTSSAPGGAESAVGQSAPVIPAPPESTSRAGLPDDHVTARHYKIAITLPTLPADQQPLAEALRTTADNAKREFMKTLPDPTERPKMADRQFQLLIDFKTVADTPAFTSVRETGMQETGGAHPAPIEGTFVFDRKAGKLIALDDLFAEPAAARKALANFAHDTLLKRFMANAPKPDEGSPEAIREWKSSMVQMLNDGTQPTTVNYSMFVVRAADDGSGPNPGLTLIFPPYQVAPYAFGTQTVEVPASVFAKFLAPGYRDAFAAR